MVTRTLGRGLLILAALVALVGVGAGSASAASEADQERAGELVAEGLKKARGGKFGEAIEKFEQALKLYPHPDIVHSLARAHEENGGLAEAWRYFNQALEMDPAYTYASDARERLAKLETRLRETHGRVRVTSTPSQVKVTLEATGQPPERLLVTPVSRWIAAGKLTLRGQKTGFEDAVKEVDVTAGMDEPIELVLRPVKKKGFLTVSANAPGAEVLIGGESIGAAPIQGMPYESGSYTLVVQAEGFKVYEQQIVIQPDKDTSVLASMERIGTVKPGEGDDDLWGAILVGAGGAVLIGGVVLHLGALGAADEANNVPADRPGEDAQNAQNARDFEDAKTRAENLQIGAFLAYGVGAALTGVGMYMLFTESGSDNPGLGMNEGSEPQWYVAPTHDGVQLGTRVTF